MQLILRKALSSYISFWCIVTKRLTKFARTCAAITIMCKQSKGLSEEWLGKGCELCGGLIPGNCGIQSEVNTNRLLHSYYFIIVAFCSYTRNFFSDVVDFELNTSEFVCKILE